jgi:hypothetical protein
MLLVLHGATKHRTSHRISKHADSLMMEPSAALFADSICRATFEQVSVEHLEMLWTAEEVDSVFQENPSRSLKDIQLDHGAVVSILWSFISNKVESDSNFKALFSKFSDDDDVSNQSLESLMAFLAFVIFPESQQPTRTIVFPSIPEIMCFSISK